MKEMIKIRIKLRWSNRTYFSERKTNLVARNNNYSNLSNLNDQEVQAYEHGD